MVFVVTARSLYYAVTCSCYFILPMYVHRCPEGVAHRSCHLIRTKSDFTKRLHHLGGLLGSSHWDALHLGDCLHSFSQQLAHSASALKQITYCLVFAGGSQQIWADRWKVRTSCAKHKIRRCRQMIGTNCQSKNNNLKVWPCESTAQTKKFRYSIVFWQQRQLSCCLPIETTIIDCYHNQI